MKVVKFYICDRAFKIADGVCTGTGCLDCEPYCNHTTDPKYAKYDPETSHNKWETVVLNDINTDEPIITEWEIDPNPDYDQRLS